MSYKITLFCLFLYLYFNYILLHILQSPLDTGHNLNVHKTQ